MRQLDVTFLYEALGSVHGIVIEVDDIERARQALYRYRREARDPDLEVLAIIPSPLVKNQLWIVRKTAIRVD